MNEIPIIHLEELRRDAWSQEEFENVKRVIDLVQHLMNNHNFDYVLKTYGQNPYVQHNRSIADGVEGVVDYFKNFTKWFPQFSYDVKHIHVDGGYVTLHSHATMRESDRGNEKKGFIIYDTWKIENGNIVEHWDALQPLNFSMRLFVVFVGGITKNKNGLY